MEKMSSDDTAAAAAASQDGSMTVSTAARAAG